MVLFTRCIGPLVRAGAGYAGGLMVPNAHKSDTGTPDTIAGYCLSGVREVKHAWREYALGIPVGKTSLRFKRGGAGRLADLCAFGTMRSIALSLRAYQQPRQAK